MRPPIPLERPGKIVCIGRNYAEHAKELGNEVPKEPVIFLKPPSSFIRDGEAIVRPTHMSERVEHEGELAVIIGLKATRVSEADALDVVRGYACANDVTARDLQKRDGRFTRAKGFDTFCPIGVHVVPATSIGDAVQALGITVRVNGVVKQQGNTRDMVFSVRKLVAYVSSIMTLEPHDAILTGTPAGVGPLVSGDVVEVEIERVGVLRNPVVDAP